MTTPDTNPYSHIDQLKSRVIIPTVADIICSEIPPTSQELCLLEVGPGDGSSTDLLLQLVKERGLGVKHIRFVETNSGMYRELSLYWAKGYFGETGIEIMEPLLSVLGDDLPMYENSFNVANIQMVLHQMSNPDLRSLLFARILMALENRGIAVITELHPSYLDYLLKEETGKFKLNETGSAGIYYSSSGVGQDVEILTLQDLVVMGLETGFKLKKVKNHDLTPAVDVKTRYQQLKENDIPMVYSMVFEKEEDRFLSYSEGCVTQCKRRGSFIDITFEDCSTRAVPFNSDLPLQVGDVAVILQVKDPGNLNAVITNLWTYTTGQENLTKRFMSVARIINEA